MIYFCPLSQSIVLIINVTDALGLGNNDTITIVNNDVNEAESESKLCAKMQITAHLMSYSFGI